VNIADYLSARFDADIRGPLGEDGVPLSACVVSPSAVEDSRTLRGLRDEALDRISSEAAPILREVLRD
jgi:hypothetical protein